MSGLQLNFPSLYFDHVIQSRHEEHKMEEKAGWTETQGPEAYVFLAQTCVLIAVRANTCVYLNQMGCSKKIKKQQLMHVHHAERCHRYKKYTPINTNNKYHKLVTKRSFSHIIKV